MKSAQRSLHILSEWSNINYCCNETEVAWICGVFFVRLRTTTTAVDGKGLLTRGEIVGSILLLWGGGRFIRSLYDGGEVLTLH